MNEIQEKKFGMNDRSIQSMNLQSVGSQLQSTHTHTPKQKHGVETEDYWQLLFHEQVFVFMSINKTGVQHNEANEEAHHLAQLL